MKPPKAKAAKRAKPVRAWVVCHKTETAMESIARYRRIGWEMIGLNFKRERCPKRDYVMRPVEIRVVTPNPRRPS